ncbi:MAG: sigma-70 family RNA polymerase sigma factor [Bacteroidota bacterium]
MRFRSKKSAFTKEDLEKAHHMYYESLRWFIFYRTRNTEFTEDLIQDVFIKLWEKRDQIEKQNIKGLLYKIASNLILNHVEHHEVVQKYHDRQGANAFIDDQSPLFIIEEKEFMEKFLRCIETMSEASREVFLMNRIDKLKYREIAERLGISIKAVEKRMGVALQKVREELGVKI